ncbi:MAG: ABC transporter substrate-binding protein [Chloroflexota bacterium]
MKWSIPWLPLDTARRPSVSYLGFNTKKPPFDNPTVRRAFAAATDRSVIVALIEKYQPEREAREAYTLTPPETLGRDLTGDVGIPYDPQRAKELLVEAGYTDVASFPTVTIFARASGAGEYPGLPLLIIEAVADSWREVLGIEVIVAATNERVSDRMASEPPDAFRFGAWAADYNDPDNFIGELFNPDGDYGGEYNYGQFSDPTFEALVNQAAGSNRPEARQLLYIQAEQLLVEDQAAIIPLYFAVYNIP